MMPNMPMEINASQPTTKYNMTVFNVSTVNMTNMVNTVNMTMSEIYEYRDELSDQMALALLPAIIVLGIILLIGVIGNTLVFYIYFFKFSPSSTRSAILALACFDLVACTVCIPGEILDLRFSYNFTSQIFCKGLRTITTIMLMASGFTLLIVAWDRFQRICHPLNDQLTAKMARNRVLIACLLATVCAIPAAMVYGLAEVPTPIQGVYGSECSTSSSYARNPLRYAHYAVLLGVFLVAFTIMIVLYIFIGKQVLRQKQFRHSVRRGSCAPAGNRRHTVCSDSLEDGEHSTSDGAKEPSMIHESIPEHDMPSNISVGSKPHHNQTTKLSRRPSVLRRLRKMSKKTDTRTRKTTLMLFFITLVFVISFLPHLLLKVIQAINKNFMDNLSMTGIIFYNIFVRSHFFNTVANAFIYGFCSPKFRHECHSLILKLAFWVKKRKVSVQSNQSG